MLVIRRRPGESLLIGPDVEIEILEAGPAHVKLGIRAPQAVRVMRAEVRLAAQQNECASQALPENFLQRFSLSRFPLAKR